MRRKRKLPMDAKPRGPCPVCHYWFAPATDREWEHRRSYHVMFSERHKKYLALPVAGGSEAEIGPRRFIRVKPLMTLDQLRAQAGRLDFDNKARP